MWDADRWNARYKEASLSYTMSPHDYLFRQRNEVYKRLLPRGNGRRILEVGAAPGDWLVYFYWELGLRPTGIDFAQDGVEVARQKLAHFGVPGEVLCADFLEYDFGAERFDVVFFQGSLEHFPDPAVPLSRAVALCQPGGMIFAQMPCLDRRNINYFLGRRLGRQALREHYLRDEDDLRMAFKDAGLRDVGVELLGTFQLMVEPDRNLGLVQRAGLRLVQAAYQVTMPVLGRLDLRRQSRRFSPHLLAYARKPHLS